MPDRTGGGAISTRRGHPVLGTAAGIVTGLGIAVLLQQAGLWPLDRLSLFGLPGLVGLLGLLWGRWAPLGRRQ